MYSCWQAIQPSVTSIFSNAYRMDAWTRSPSLMSKSDSALSRTVRRIGPSASLPMWYTSSLHWYQRPLLIPILFQHTSLLILLTGMSVIQILVCGIGATLMFWSWRWSWHTTWTCQYCQFVSWCPICVQPSGKHGHCVGYSVVPLTPHIPANTGHRHNAATRMTHRLPRPSICLALGRCLVFSGMIWCTILCPIHYRNSIWSYTYCLLIVFTPSPSVYRPVMQILSLTWCHAW